MEVQYLCELSKSLPCGLVAGKSLMLMAIVVDNPFRSPNGRLSVVEPDSVCNKAEINDLPKTTRARKHPTTLLQRRCLASGSLKNKTQRGTPH